MPYKLEYEGRPCKSKSIPMNTEYIDFCNKEIKIFLNRKLIRESDSPWNCYSFYVNKRLKKIKGIPRLVINDKPLNFFLSYNTYPIPHKGDLLARIVGAKIFSKFDMKSSF